MHVHIAEVHKVLFDGEAHSLTVPGADGVLTILPHHEPLLTTLKPGTITVRAQEGDTHLPVDSGVLEVHPEGVVILL